jgi:recombination protein RecA
MPASSALRIQIERALEHRYPAALTPAPRAIREMASTGITEVDALLGGGLPIGAISELTGPESSGRTSLALSFVTQRTNADQVCAWVDVDDALDPESAAACGIALERLLWVRCRNAEREVKTRLWTRLDQALRAADLLLQAGGFAAIILDLGNVAPKHGTRIPLATWFRFRQAADRTRCSLVVLGKASYAQSSAAAVLDCLPQSKESAGETVLRRFIYETRRRRDRFESISVGTRKPPASTWSVNAPSERRRRA